MKKIGSKWLIGAAILGLLLVPVVMKAMRSQPAQVVETEKLAQHEIKASILASGNLVYQEQALLSPEVIAKVSEILVKEGDLVERGQIVLRLNDQTYRAQVAQQEAAVRQQRINIEHKKLNLDNQLSQYMRKQELHEKKMVSDQHLDDARFAVDLAKVDLRTSGESLQQAEAMLNQTKELMAKTIIRAPISGTVTSLDIKVGETAVSSQVSIAGSSLMTIANTATIMTEVNVDEADIARTKVGQEVSIHTAAFPDVELKGTVLTIPLSFKRYDGQQAGALTRSYLVKVKLVDTRNLALRPGMTCRAEIYTSTSGKSLAVPLQAVLSNNDEKAAEIDKAKKSKGSIVIENYIFLNKKGTADKRAVKIGMSDDSLQEILSGVQAGEEIITGPYKVLRHLKQGDKITTTKAAL